MSQAISLHCHRLEVPVRRRVLVSTQPVTYLNYLLMNLAETQVHRLRILILPARPLATYQLVEFIQVVCPHLVMPARVLVARLANLPALHQATAKDLTRVAFPLPVIQRISLLLYPVHHPADTLANPRANRLRHRKAKIQAVDLLQEPTIRHRRQLSNPFLYRFLLSLLFRIREEISLNSPLDFLVPCS